MSSGAAANANSGVENPGSGNGQNAGSGQNAGTGGEGQPANDGGASAAGPRENNAQEQANQIVNSSKEKIAAAAQNTAAEKAVPPENRARLKARTKTARKTIKKTMRPRKRPKPRSKNCSAPSAVLSLRKKNWRSSSGIWAANLPPEMRPVRTTNCRKR